MSVYVTKHRLQQKRHEVQCVDVVVDQKTQVGFIDKHTNMTLSKTYSNMALKELDVLLTLHSGSKVNYQFADGQEHIVNLKEHFLDGNRLHLIQEFCTRGDLLTLIQKESRKQIAGLLKKSTIDCLQLMKQITSGMAFLHSKGIAHLDLSLENIFIRENHTICIGDFGLSERFQQETRLQMMNSIGKPMYAAPEVYLPNTKIDLIKVDAWSLGIIMWMLITKRALISKATKADPFFMKMKQLGTRKALENIPEFDHLSNEMYDLLCQLLEIDPSKRITIEQALQHPWFKPVIAADRTSDCTITSTTTTNRLVSKLDSLTLSGKKNRQNRIRSQTDEIDLEKTKYSLSMSDSQAMIHSYTSSCGSSSSRKSINTSTSSSTRANTPTSNSVLYFFSVKV